MTKTKRNKSGKTTTKTTKTTKDIFGIASELAAERYWIAREYDNGERSRKHLLAKAAESVFCCLDSDILEKAYSREDFAKQEEIAKVVADSYGLTLEEVFAE